MVKRMPTHHIELITHVHHNWEIYYPMYLTQKRLRREERLWRWFWVALASMKGLRWLRVELRLARPIGDPAWTEQEHVLWWDVKRVTSPGFFELVLPWPAHPSTSEEVLPCTIVRKIPPIRWF